MRLATLAKATFEECPLRLVFNFVFNLRPRRATNSAGLTDQTTSVTAIATATPRPSEPTSIRARARSSVQIEPIVSPIPSAIIAAIRNARET